MTGVGEDELKTLTGFPGGVNNMTPIQDLPRDKDGNIISLRAAVNTDLVGPGKKPRRRQGYTLSLAGRSHSPFALTNTLFAVIAGDLNRYQSSGAPGSLALTGTVRAGVGNRYLTYAEVNGDVYWSSPTQIRRIRGSDFADLPVWVDNLGVPNVAAVANGGMNPGTYRVSITWMDAEGRESGAEGQAEITLVAGQGILVNQIPAAPESAITFRIYCSQPDGEEQYAVIDLPVATSSYTLQGGGSFGYGRALDTLWLDVMPPCTILRYWNGRLLGVTGVASDLLVWSEPLRVGLTTSDSYMRFGKGIGLLEPLGHGDEQGAGVFIADHKNTYWMSGSKPNDWRRVIRYDHPAVPGTSLIVKGTDVGLETTQNVAFWLAKNGVFCVGLPGGEVKPLTEGRLAMPYGESGATMFREYNGLRQLVTSFLNSGGNGLAVSDYTSATVTSANTP